MKLCLDPRGIFMRGLGRNPEGRWVQPERVVSPVLCTSHNTALEPFDAFAGLFGDELIRTTRALRSGQGISSVVSFSGDNLERWMLKALCGLVASNQAARIDGTPLSTDISETWVRWLFGQADLLPPLGLYVQGELGHNQDFTSSVVIGPLSRAGKVVGIEFSFQWFKASLILADWLGDPMGAINSSSVRRPQSLVLQHENTEYHLQFGWSHGAGPGVQMTYTPPSPV